MRQIKLTQDFATRKKGDVFACESMTASKLVTRGVAKYTKKAEKQQEIVVGTETIPVEETELEQWKRQYAKVIGRNPQGKNANNIEYLKTKIKEAEESE